MFEVFIRCGRGYHCRKRNHNHAQNDLSYVQEDPFCLDTMNNNVEIISL